MTSPDDPKPAAELAALDYRGNGLRVRFYWQADRYVHRIEALDGPLTRVLLESVEGDGKSTWPPSPPLQHVNVSWIQSVREQGHVAMLIGSSGGSHWSVCVAAHDAKSRHDNSAETEISFDVACRTGCPPEFLGSTYRSIAGSVALSETMNCAFAPAEAPGLAIIPQNAELKIENRRTPWPTLRCEPAEIRINELPATVRWHYVIRRSSGGPLKVERRTTHKSENTK